LQLIVCLNTRTSMTEAASLATSNSEVVHLADYRRA
jgi:hypothetical protein